MTTDYVNPEKSEVVKAALMEQIDAMDYAAMFRVWRFAPSGDPMVCGEVGEYLAKRMQEIRDKPGGDALHVATSKMLGWDR